MTAEAPPPAPRRRKGGRPKGDPAAVRALTIGVRVSPDEYAALQAKAQQMGMTPAHWLREAALSRRLPSPPVPPINREKYAELARLSGNFNQLLRAIHERRVAAVDEALLYQLAAEIGQLRLDLIGAGRGE